MVRPVQQAGGAAAPRERNHQLDLLRILFATLVLLAHAPELTDGNRSRELLTLLTHSISFGELGVDGFFLLSGYLIVQSWVLDPEPVNFVRKRALRIVPGYLVAVLVTIMAAGLLAPGVPHFFQQFRPAFFKHLVLLGDPPTPPVFPGMPIPVVNGSLWTIAYEVRCYLTVAILGMLGCVRRPWVWLVCTAFLALANVSNALRMLISPHHGWVLLLGDGAVIARLDAVFFVGGCFYLFRKHIIFRPLLVWVAIASLVLCWALHVFVEGGLVLFGGYLLFYLNQLSLPQLRWMRRFPDISYGMYLYGWTVESLWIWYVHGSPWVTFAVSTVLCAALGWLSWHAVERPALKWKRRPTAALPAA